VTGTCVTCACFRLAGLVSTRSCSSNGARHGSPAAHGQEAPVQAEAVDEWNRKRIRLLSNKKFLGCFVGRKWIH